jgi:hypothetical protein
LADESRFGAVRTPAGKIADLESGGQAPGPTLNTLSICPAREFGDLTLKLRSENRVLWETRTAMSPDRPFSAVIDGLGTAHPLTLVIESGGEILLKKELVL